MRWHDDTLEFEVTIPTAGDVVHFRMILNGRNTAELKRFAGENLPESSISLRRQVQL